ncbi:2Fe-2S ferredoxin [Tritrichomonas foetus]|uniref:2Fe-2S ferredoxin n=1 Tax=Tritrichomonas foetus TaxID=1144522 RepID=A0A1J4K901_9EUKA|nr:2Fe-2S ferredoxin [Tritrichomonas foetus]|eukprot:OHT07418.1 2Fe-2S ferredoxin [Tritrichomonas foetus]
MTIIGRGGEKIPVTFNEGDRLYDAIEDTPAKELQGNCGGNQICGGCHCILDAKVYTKPSEDEEDGLGSSVGVTSTSRLACNLTLTSDFDGTTITMGPL